MKRFMAMQNTACSDASSCAPAACDCASESCCIRSDMAVLAVSFFIMILVSICLSILGLIGLLVRLVLAWGIVSLLILGLRQDTAKSNGEMEMAAAA